MALQACTGGLEVTIAVCHAKIGDVLSFSHDKSLRFCHLLARLISALHRLRTITVYKKEAKAHGGEIEQKLTKTPPCGRESSAREREAIQLFFS